MLYPAAIYLCRFRSLYLRGVPIEDFWRYLGFSLLSGASSGAVSLAVLYPLDFARTRVGTDVRASGNRQFRGSVDCLRQAYSTVVSERCLFFRFSFFVSCPWIAVEHVPTHTSPSWIETHTTPQTETDPTRHTHTLIFGSDDRHNQTAVRRKKR